MQVETSCTVGEFRGYLRSVRREALLNCLSGHDHALVKDVLVDPEKTAKGLERQKWLLYGLGLGSTLLALGCVAASMPVVGAVGAVSAVTLYWLGNRNERKADGVRFQGLAMRQALESTGFAQYVKSQRFQNRQTPGWFSMDVDQRHRAA